jgi:Protein of unknown function (DUF1189)
MKQNEQGPSAQTDGTHRRFHERREISSTGLAGSLARVGTLPTIFVLLACAGLAALSLISLVTPAIEKAADLVMNQYDVYVPEITIENGQARIREKQPYFIDTGDSDEKGVAVIDTREGKEDDALKYLKQAGWGVVLTRDSLHTKNRNGQIRILPLKQFPDMVINSENLRTLKDEYLPLVLSVIIAALIVYFLLAKPFQALLLALIPYAAVRSYSVDLSYGQAFKIAAFCMVPPVILDAGMDILGIHIPWGFFVYFGIYVALMVFASIDLVRTPQGPDYPAQQIGPGMR